MPAGLREYFIEKDMVGGVAGLEPAAPCLQSRKANLLNLAGDDANR
jgi:hypothetical protein